MEELPQPTLFSARASLARYRSRFTLTSTDSGMSGISHVITQLIKKTTCWK